VSLETDESTNFNQNNELTVKDSFDSVNKINSYDSDLLVEYDDEKRLKYLYTFLYNFKDFSWEQIEKMVKFEDKRNIILKLELDDYYKLQVNESYGKEFAKGFHLIDFNQDGYYDVIYNNADGADSDLIRIWINNEGVYKEIFLYPGTIQNLIHVDNTWKGFVVNPSCCFNPYHEIYEFQINKDSVEILTKKAILVSNSIPKNLAHITSFEVSKSNYLRSYPSIKNEPCIDLFWNGEEYCGNIIGVLEKGMVGKAYSSVQDSTNRIWWFSEINVSPDYSIFGWISSTYLIY
jgi:hypothetical protein